MKTDELLDYIKDLECFIALGTEIKLPDVISRQIINKNVDMEYKAKLLKHTNIVLTSRMRVFDVDNVKKAITIDCLGESTDK